jgi:hypothetical protein
MKPFEAYKIYLAMRLHFTSPKYDIVKSKGAVRASEYTFMQKKERFTFAKVASRYTKPQFVSLLAANFAAGDRYGGMYQLGQADSVYKEWMKRTESLTYRYKQELELLSSEYGNPKLIAPECFWRLVREDESHPPLIHCYLAKQVSLETLVIFNKLFQFTDKTEVTDPVIEEVISLVRKYSPFVRVPREHFLTITTTQLGL